MEYRNDGHSEDFSHTLTQLEHDSYRTTAASHNPSLNADSIMSDFMQGILPSYDSSGMEDFKSPTAAEFGSSEELMDSESGHFSMMFQERGSASDEDGRSKYSYHPSEIAPHKRCLLTGHRTGTPYDRYDHGRIVRSCSSEYHDTILS